MNRLARRFVTVAAAAMVASPALVLPATEAGASVPAISANAFGMHFLQHGSYPPLTFASARIWNNGVTWAALQPKAPTYTPAVPATLVSPGTPASSTTGFDAKAVAKLDSLVRMFVNRHADPMITLGMTPAWAANTSGCNYGSYGVQTCLPKNTYTDSNGHAFGDPWRNYVSFLSTRYDGHHSDAKGTLPKVTYFELWNEPNYRNGMNGSWSTAIPKLASMQAGAYSLLHARGQRMISPGIPFTVGGGYTFLNSFLKASGGKKYDILGLHLYPSDATATGGYGPEWVMNTVLPKVRTILSNNKVAGRPIWDTETNVGRVAAHNAVKGSVTGAAYVARTFILATQNKIARTFWYAADDHAWGGVWLENTNYTRSYAGTGYQAVRARLVGKAALGCSRVTVGTHKWKYTCKFGTTTGHKTLLAIWTTGASYTLKAPAGTKHWYNWKGTYRSAYAGKKFTITHTPIYLAGSFK